MARRSLIPINPGCRFGRLTVIERAGLTSIGGYRWKCQCDCGNISYPDAASLRRGHSQSCGCLSRETASNNIKDLTGQHFGFLTVLERAKSRSPRAQWRCRCICGTEKIISGNNLRNGHTKSCGCRGLPPITSGIRFGRLIVLSRAGAGPSGDIQYTCLCDCGNITQPTAANLRRGDTLSCGCLRLDRITSHRETGTPLYQCWQDIKQRCYNPKCAEFKNYGGRGITMASEWIDDFEAFRDYVDQNLGPRPEGYSIDRIENHEGYFPGNLRWGSKIEQANNSRRSKIEKDTNAIIQECINKFAKRRRRRIAHEV
jgi:hypothetical protein